MSCIFCSIARADARAHVVYEDEQTVAFLDLNPATAGHTLVVPKQHADDIWSIDPETFVHVARTTHAVAELVRERLRPDGVTLFQANRPAGWQDVFHLHVHVVPRYDGDALIRPWKSSPERGEELQRVATRPGARTRP